MLAPSLAACARSSAPPAPPTPNAAPAPAAGPPALGPARINYSAIAAVMAGIWTAAETGAWQECGVELELSNVNASARVLPALLAHEIDGSSLDVMAGVRAISGGADVVFLGGVTNRQIFSVFARPDIAQPADLAGHTWGVTRLGSSTDVAAHLALEQWGLTDDDITFVQLGDTPTVIAALLGGQIDAASLGPPNDLRAKEAGFKELLNLAEEGPAFPSVGLAATRSLVADRPETAYCFVKGYALGVKRFREDRDTALAVYRKYLQTDDAHMLDATYTAFKRYLAWPPAIPADGLDRVRQAVAAREEPHAAELTNAQIFDSQFVDQLQAEGLFA
ncbi:MAG TPA: ABC transporter substrate-binding protein [Chloroflexota bacterium]|nr:ABC transporter substrate-binding protein [Chloroflexota bacterium]